MDITISFDRRSYKWCKQEHVNLVRLKTYEKQLNRQLECINMYCYEMYLKY